MKEVEKDYVYCVKSDASLLNEDNILKPYAYQIFFGQIAEEHLSKIDINIDSTLKYDLSWVLISLCVEVVKPIEGCMELFANTWFSQRKGPFFRREFLFKNSIGEIMFKGCSYSVLLDVKKRSIYRQKELPFVIHEPTEEFTIESTPTFKIDAEFSKVEERKVYNSYIDCLGHVNNVRYGEFAYDALTNAEKAKLASMKRIDINFLSELRRNDTFSILKAQQGNTIYTRGFNNNKEDVSFNVKMEFTS